MLEEQYPKWKYHAQKDGLVVFNATEEIELGDDWYDNQLTATMAGVKAKKPKAAVEVKEEPVVEETKEEIVEEKIEKPKKKSTK